MADRPDSPTEPVPTGVRRPRVRQRPRTPHEARQWRRRMAGYAVAAVSFVLVVNALVGENGYLATMQARRASAQLTDELRRVREDNQQMRDRARRLKEDPAELEDEARRMRLSKPGETMVIIKDIPKAKSPQPPER